MTLPDSIDEKITEMESRLQALDRERTEISERIEELRHQKRTPSTVAAKIETGVAVTMASPTTAKVALFRSLFRGRTDVFPRRWENQKAKMGSGYAPACRDEWVRGICGKRNGVKCGECPNQAFLPVDDRCIHDHLSGKGGRDKDGTIGVYAMLPDETCWFLAADFDKGSWMRDVAALRDAAAELAVPVAIERSRSGNGGHAWIFFTAPVPAAEARRLGALLLTRAMERCPDIGFDSYDRFFPSQDTMPAGGFGNLIALPLQRRPRENGNSLFVDEDFQPYPDQWAFLADVRRMTPHEVSVVVAKAAASGRILGVQLPATEDDNEPWSAPPSRRRTEPLITADLPQRVALVLGNQIYIQRADLPAQLITRLVRLAAFQNPEFYAAQGMRLPTFDKPRIISCAELFPQHLALPRGCLTEVRTLLTGLGIQFEIRDERQLGTPIDAHFLGELTAEQERATQALMTEDTGVLAATTAFGKTVVAARLIAARGRNTLVMVHRRQLLDQWVARLAMFLDIPVNQVGVIHGGRKKPTGLIDVALMQSLTRQGEVADAVANYGHLIVDECHHLAAVAFEQVAREAKARYVLGLSATVTRKDGHQPIIFMQCGPVRYRVDARKQAAERPFDHHVVFRRTGFRFERKNIDDKPPIQALYAALAADQQRNDMIFNDILFALESRRSPVVITERRDHLAALADRLEKFAKNVIVLQGGMSNRQRRQAMERLAAIPEGEERLLLSTGRYLGEGFDDARLDTLFLTMPIAWRGTLAQYAGRLHRLFATKREVIIYDYVDGDEPMLARMARKRETGYDSLGYREIAFGGSSPEQRQFRLPEC